MTTMTNGYAGTYELEFERPLIQLERQIAELESHATSAGVDIATDIRKLRASHTAMLKKIYAHLGAWETIMVARHQGRPQPIDYINAFVKDFCELHGDRRYGDDRALLTGFGRIGPYKTLIIASNKGKDVKERVECNFGMAHPEGYRKALAKMKLAEKYGLPVVCLIDTAGAYPGIGAEERGQAQAIAVNLLEMSRLKVPIVAVIVGEGGSGGALGVGVADKVAMMQYAWYSVISPEGCAGILWKTATPETKAKAAEALKLTAPDNLRLGIVDAVIAEPLGAAHRNPAVAAEHLEKWLVGTIRELKRYKVANLVNRRFDKWRQMGQIDEGHKAR